MYVRSPPSTKQSSCSGGRRSRSTSRSKQDSSAAGFTRALKPNSRCNYINVAIWESEEVYWNAYEQSVTPMKAKLGQLGVDMTPALYHVAFEY